MNFKTIGVRIRNIRIEKGISQEELAFRINTSAAYVSNIERGIKKPSLMKLIDISDVLHITVNDLIYDNPDFINKYYDDELFKILSACELEKQEIVKNSIKDIIQLFNTQ